jgi:hypothetical protein
MDPNSDPDLITVKVTVPGPDGEPAIRKFKVTYDELQKDVIHETVVALSWFGWLADCSFLDERHSWL